MFVAPRAARDDGDARPPGHVGVTLGRVSGALLVADVNVPDRRVEDRVVDGKDGAPREAEGDLDALRLEALDQGLCSSHFHCFSIPRVSDAICLQRTAVLPQHAENKTTPLSGGRMRTDGYNRRALFKDYDGRQRSAAFSASRKSLSERPGYGKPPSGDELRVP